MKKVSVITINFNNAAGLKLTIESVINQTIPVDYVIIDGGSTDESVQVIEQYKDRIDSWVSEPDKGIYDAMNKGIGKATGEYCLFLNSGDTLTDKHILARVFEKEPDDDILFGDLIFDYGYGLRKVEVLPEKLTISFLFQHNIWHPAAFIRRNLFNTSGNYDTGFRIAGDYEFFFRVLTRDNVSFRHIPYPVSVYDFDGISSKPENAKKIAEERSRVHHAYLNEHTIRELNNLIRFRNEPVAKFIANNILLHKAANQLYDVAVSLRNSFKRKGQRTRITFFTPTLWPTGSEIVIRNLLQTLPDEYQVSVISRYKGTLAADLPGFIRYYYFYSNPGGSLIQKAFKLFRRSVYIPWLYRTHKNSLWYINTIALPDVLSYAEKHRIRTILHVHELEHMFAKLAPDEVQRAVHYPHLLIANSQLSRKYLLDAGTPKPVEIIYPALDTSAIRKDEELYSAQRTVLGIESDEFLWLMSGTVDENKNTMLFVETAIEILKDRKKTRFMWIGAVTDNSYMQKCLQRAESAGIASEIHWIRPEQKDYYLYFNCADGFFLTSEAESFSLVTLEALLRGLPIVTQDSGGVREVLGVNTGTIVSEKNDPEKMAAAMIGYMDKIIIPDRELQQNQASRFDIRIWSQRWKKILKKVIQWQ